MEAPKCRFLNHTRRIRIFGDKSIQGILKNARSTEKSNVQPGLGITTRAPGIHKRSSSCGTLQSHRLCCLVIQSCLTLCDPMDCSPPGSSVHGIFRQEYWSGVLLPSPMTNLDRILKSRDITLPTKVCLVKAMVFPVVMYGCESWTVKKAER